MSPISVKTGYKAGETPESPGRLEGTSGLGLKRGQKSRPVVASGHLARLTNSFFCSFHKNVLGIVCEDTEMSRTVLKELDWTK